MLELRNITKTYITGDLRQDALKSVSISFRDSEFVSILGHSGSGKTTMLNIIGGLDQYTSGDLIINGVSTKNYKDRDWDTYRNHDIGFVFQSYNLIPHQTVLANVELALTLSGVSKSEREKRATEALRKVGLIDHIHKRPNQLSGGQMQRVAIARALVNNPHILLADEPTGALDSETSVQVMNILKEIATDKLVIMVTHNPELAYEYSDRIVKLADGNITDDTNPFNENSEIIDKPVRKKLRSMSFFTALSLSLNNLMTKKLRTFMTSFAGSIGIMGIALILSVSTGFQKYIDSIEENTLSSYPLSITAETANATTALLSIAGESQKSDRDDDVVVEKQYITKMLTSIGTNDLKSFKKYLTLNADEVDKMASMVIYNYSVSPLIYGIDATNTIVKVNPSSYGSRSSMSFMSSMGSGSVFNEMISDFDALKENYEVLAGKWPENYDELLLVLSDRNGMTDMMAYSLGLKDTSKFRELMQSVYAGNTDNVVQEDSIEVTYDQLLQLEYKLVDPTSLYKYNEEYNVYENMSDSQEAMEKIYQEAETLKIVGIVCLKESAESTALSAGVCYTQELTSHVMEKAKVSEIVLKQLNDKEVNVFTGKRFDDEAKESTLDFNNMISVDSKALSSAFKVNTNISSIDSDKILQLSKKYLEKISEGALTDTSTARSDLDNLLLVVLTNSFEDYCNYIKDEAGYVDLSVNKVEEFLSTYFDEQYKGQFTSVKKAYGLTSSELEDHYKEIVKKYLPFAVKSENTGSPVRYEVVVAQGKPLAQIYISMLMSADTSDPNYDETKDENVIFDNYAAAMTMSQIGTTISNNSSKVSQEFAKDIATIFGNNLISVDGKKIASAFKFNMDEESLTRLMSSMNGTSTITTYSTNLLALNYQDIDEPTSISFYFKDFASKQKLKDFIGDYNKNVDEKQKISYTDITGILMGSVETIINAVTYVLIAFVSISLVVSTIMIGVITLISVMERTKEIGILRSIGASKRDVGNVFNAETFIVGLLSGIIGIVGSLLLLIPINQILYKLTELNSLKAQLPMESCSILIIISVVLTLISGLIPASSASKKNPVEALRTE